MNSLKPRQIDNAKLAAKYEQFKSLLKELDNRELSEEVLEVVNNEVITINASADKGLHKHLTGAKTRIFRKLMTVYKLVPKNYYRTTWLLLGMTALGLPFGTAFALSLGNTAFIGIGLPIGMALGMAIGAKMDKKAEEEGRQLDFSV